jgi:hypothetical protein
MLESTVGASILDKYISLISLCSPYFRDLPERERNAESILLLFSSVNRKFTIWI